ncbi:hypothetical protein NXF25_004812 [Crotalus adamanteus]|uniref:Peptidase A2 domain-containing protein n=1 Tax=Crotalus adamanteus TaxID=8729 RepID=A0AAW1BX49_CROAD
MAKIGRLSEFDISHPERWESYVARVENYLKVNQVREENLKAATLLCACGQDAFEIAENPAAPVPLESVSYADLKKLLKEHFQPKMSVIAWRHTFEQRDQRPGESAKEYIAALRKAAKHCEFKDLEERLRDRFVCGLRHRELQQRLFAKEDLSFQDALREVTAEEAPGGAIKNMRPIRNSPDAASVHQEEVQRNSEEDSDEEVDRLHPTKEGKQKGSSSALPKCIGCGGRHKRTDCKFRSAICRACGKQGHIVVVCLGRQKVQPQEELRLKGTRVPSQNRVGFCASRRSIYRTGTHKPIKKKLSLKVKLQGVPLAMELDTGSALSIISMQTFRKICSGSGTQAKLRPSDIVLTDFQNSRVCVKGEATLNVQYKDFEGPLDIIVVGGERTSLIGLDWFEALGIHVTGLNSLQTLDLQEVCKEFADVFSPQLGTYKGPPVSLKLDPTVTPIRIKARRVPFALKSKIDTELDKLIQQGVLEPVDSSPWETPIVTPLKANGDIRICADYKCALNKALQQHAYPVTVVSHILASLKGGVRFCKA